MDTIVHVLDTVIAPAASVGIACIREWSIFRLLGYELVGQGMKPTPQRLVRKCYIGLEPTLRRWLAIAYSQDLAGFGQQHRDIARYCGMKLLEFRETIVYAEISNKPAGDCI